MSTADFVVVGFPKCGTSALVRLVERLPGVRIDRRNGALEAPFYTSDEGVEELRRQQGEAGETLNGHKFTAYIYNPGALRRLARDNFDPLFIVCVRDPLRSLVSWHEMHRRIAEAGTKHFVNETAESSEFYRTASLDAYYERFAKPRLEYAGHIRRLLTVLDEPRLMVIAQERLAADPEGVSREFLAALGGVAEFAASPESPASPSKPHVGFADRVDDVPVSDEVARDLRVQREALQALLAELADRENVTVLA